MMMAVTTMVMTACSAVDEQPENEQVVVPEAVSFGAYVNRGTTRAGVGGPLTTDSLTTLPSADPAYLGYHNTAGFGVFAYYTDGTRYSQLSLPNFMYNQQVAWDGSKWTYSPIKYWPNEFGGGGSSEADFLTFFAYAPYVDVSPTTGLVTANDRCGIFGLTSSKESGDPVVKYHTNYDLTKQVDLCYGVAPAGGFSSTVTGAGTINNIEAGQPYIDVVKPTIASQITFNFKHALAALNVQIDADMDVASHAPSSLDANTRIWVRSVTFDGFADKGQLNLNIGNWNNLDCDCDVESRPITIYDGRRDRYEGVSASLNETAGLNPTIVQSTKYVTDGTTITSPATTLGVTNTPVNLFDTSGWPYANPASPTDEEIEKALAAPIYVIPTNQPLRVTIVYDVETYDPKLVSQYLSDGSTNGSTIENNITANITDGSSDPIVLEAGKAYTVNLHLGMTSVKMEAEVTEWAVGATATVPLPDNE